MCGTLVVHTVLQVLDAHSHRLAKRAASFDEHSSPRPPPGSTAAGHLSAHMLRFRAHSPATSQGSGDEGERRGTAVLTFLAQEDRVGRCWTMQGGPARGRRVAGLVDDEFCKGRRGNFSVFASRETGPSGFCRLYSRKHKRCATSGTAACPLSRVELLSPLPFALSLASGHV
ncbi:RHTO0S04e04060g1_1 [Rhodotorula toruloides]|uniref:RHTO0S04e04060g1_1 n=2 Tax=Rhodotorula toruloides TaxID=5286 RepID=A0A061AX93_RHOTO|nr:uncharacterized protein RHTO_02490 [Rhodotorula toruloides NP11]EMS20542.1 hypothetical protein RHTO_02490 [Rhodotorula toruloides NP11]CDR39334.1 RHTO0S04e04060g1_1 [Rhodotorula toruloides]